MSNAKRMDPPYLRGAAEQDMWFTTDSGLLVPVTGAKTVGYVPTLQGDGTVAWATGGGGAADLDDLTDVVLAGSPYTDGKVLRADGDEFRSAVLSIDDLSEVSLSAWSAGHYLRYNGSALVNTTIQDGDLPADLSANARVGVRKNSTGSTHKRRRINLIEGDGVAITIADDSGDEEVDVTLDVDVGSGGSGQVPTWVEQDPKTPPGSAGDLDDEFDDTSGNSGPVNGLDGSWAWRNQGSATVTHTVQKAIVLTCPPNGASTNGLRGIEQTVSGAFEITAECHPVNADLSTWEAGLWIANNSNGKLMTLGPGRGLIAANTRGLAVAAWTNATTFSALRSGSVQTAEHLLQSRWIWLRISCDGTNLSFSWSASGIDGTWSVINTETIATHLGTCDRAGFFANAAMATFGVSLVVRSFRGNA